jgi:hypothetical protein
MILNRFFLGIVVLAIIIFLVGKIIKAFHAGDDVASVQSPTSVEQTLVLISKDANTFGKYRSFSDLENLFGDKVVFVSATEPAFLITDDQQRFEIGEVPGTHVELSSITSTQIVLKQAEELLVFALPDVSTH